MNSSVDLPKKTVISELAQECLRRLMTTWFEFERDLNKVPIVKRLNSGTFSKDDYEALLKTLRQQVIEGARWMTRTASSFESNMVDVRAHVIKHSKEEHQDFKLLEKDYCMIGGKLDDILKHPKNPGSEALHSYLMYQSSLPNPINMLGAMWIVEGLGEKMAADWADKISDQLNLNGKGVSFMKYHSAHDEEHMQLLYQLLDRVCQTEGDVDALVKNAVITGKLYAMQLNEIEHDLPK